MFINKLHSVTQQKATKTNRKAAHEIILKPFVDLYFDTAGWYSLGHHEPKAFLQAVVQKEPYADFSTAQVQLTWAEFDGDNLIISEFPSNQSQAITLVEDDGSYLTLNPLSDFT